MIPLDQRGKDERKNEDEDGDEVVARAGRGQGEGTAEDEGKARAWRGQGAGDSLSLALVMRASPCWRSNACTAHLAVTVTSTSGIHARLQAGAARDAAGARGRQAAEKADWYVYCLPRSGKWELALSTSSLTFCTNEERFARLPT